MKPPPSRRRFLAAAPALAALPGLSRGAERAGPLAGKIRLAVKYHMIREPALAVREKFAMLQELGFDGTELKTDEKVDPAEIEKAIESTGLPLHGIVNAGSEEILPALELARRFGCESVLSFAREFPELDYRRNFERWQANVRRALPFAEQHGIFLCIENVRATFLKTAEDMAEYIDSFDSEMVRSYFDLGNTITWTEQPAEHWAEVLGKRIHKLDIKDRGHPEFGEPKLARDGASGTDGGEVNWKRVREILVANDFSGWATAEVAGGDRERLAGIAGWMRDVLDLGSG